MSTRNELSAQLHHISVCLHRTTAYAVLPSTWSVDSSTFPSTMSHICSALIPFRYLLSVLQAWTCEGELRAVLHTHSEAVTCLASDGFFLFSGSEDSTIGAWDMHSLAGAPAAPGAMASAFPGSVPSPPGLPCIHVRQQLRRTQYV